MLSDPSTPAPRTVEHTTRPGATAFDWLTEVHLDQALSANDLRVASRLARYGNWVDRPEAGKKALEDARPGATRIAHDLGMERRNVYRHLQKLEARGWAEQVSKGGIKGQQRRASEYALRFPAAMSLTAETHTDPVPAPMSLSPESSTSLTGESSTSLSGETPPEQYPSNPIATTTPGAKAEKKDAYDSEGGATRGVPTNWTPKAKHEELIESRALRSGYQERTFRDYNANTNPTDWDALYTRWLERARPDTVKSWPTVKVPSKVGEHADWMIPR